MKTIDGTHVPLAAKGIRCDVRASITWRRVRRSEARPRAVSPRRRMRRAQQKTRERCISRGFFTPSSNRIASTQSMVRGPDSNMATNLNIYKDRSLPHKKYTNRNTNTSERLEGTATA
ncbi:hypothetical protein [Burkholderia sp. BCC0397]|uniref:hypothetical protein n=1 Tax=Burkholderia sp. BCC0397 TaxID=486876 RepID=UPI00158A0AF9|nr:hypothetical protein [Burkholderia sp. BCC0397]